MEHVQEVAQQPPCAEQRIPMTYAEFIERFEDSTHAEWVNGEAIIFMFPNTRHQRIVDYLTMLLGIFIRVHNLGELFEAPYAMRIHPDGNVREPDILFVAQENAHRVDTQRLNGPADLVIEVISTESLYRDRTDKFYEYQVGGVREYWVIDPRPGVTRVDFWVLDEDGRYRPVPIDADGMYLSTVLPNFRLNASSLLADKVPDPLKDAATLVDADAMMRAMGYIK